MRLRAIKKYIFLLGILFPGLLNAQLQRNYTTYNVDNGLGQNTVWDAIQDHRGFMWFSTADGLNRFDGYTMKSYKNKINDSTSIYGTTGFNFFQDAKNVLWIGHDRGLSIYDRIHDKFINLYKNPNGISIMGVDSNGILWTVSVGKYIYGFNLENGKLIHQVFINQNWHNSYGSIVTSVKINGSFFIGLSDNVCLQFNPYNKYHVKHRSPVLINSTIHVLDSNRFCSFLGNRAAIFTVKNDSVQIKIKYYPKLDTSTFVFSGGIIFNNKLYCGGINGVFVFNRQTLELEDQLTHFNNGLTESYSYIQTLRFDNSGNLYICTNGAGLFVYSPFRNRFKHYTNYAPKKSLFKSIITTKDGRIFAGAYAEGVTIFQPNGKFQFLKMPDMSGNESVSALYKLGEDELLLTLFFKLIKYQLKSGKIKYIDIDKKYISCAYPYYYKVRNELWLNRNNTEDACIQDVFTNKRILEIKNNTITCYQKLNENLLLMGTKRGLFLYDFKTKLTKTTDVNEFVKSICIAKDKKIYVGTIVGLYIYDANLKLLKYINNGNGLADNFIYGVLEDNYKNIWFSHNKGLSVYNPTSEKLKHYSVKDGLQSNEFNTGAYYKDENGLLYFGGVNGINVIDSKNIIENKNAPQIAINEILLGDVPYKTDTTYNEIKSLKLSYLDNTLSFDFSALEFSQPEQNTYQYFLEGYDKNWIQSGTKHFARYANLPPGEYTFKIKAANGDGYWNETPRTITISITPPFWKTNWFYVLMGLLAIVILSFLAWLIIRRQKLKLERAYEIQRKLEEERLRISRDLHDNVGAQLSYLITNIEWMLQHPEQMSEAEEKQRLQALSEAGKNAILTLRQTIWAISHKSLMVDDFADRFKQFVLKMLEFDKSIRVQFSDDFTVIRELSPALALNFFRICQEAFANALKHAKADKLDIQFSSSTEYVFKFSIKDNGKGFNWVEGQKNGHYGLINMRARAEEMGAKLEICSKEGEGAEVILSYK
ncbi:MAG: triple tyrosine motif-containing protein [Bacteroidia bacterium]